MINVKKGPAHSLGQSDIRGNWITGITAGMLCSVISTGAIAKGGIGATGLRGFAINNSTDGDAIESNKIALYTLDGASIIETDQTDTSADGALNATTYPVGTPIYSSLTALGTVSKAFTNAATNGNPIGWVEGIRFLQRSSEDSRVAAADSQSYTSATEQAAYDASNSAGNTNLPAYTASSKTGSFKAQIAVPVLSIKLASSN